MEFLISATVGHASKSIPFVRSSRTDVQTCDLLVIKSEGESSVYNEICLHQLAV